jgi:SMI1-KNR4 cell-wall
MGASLAMNWKEHIQAICAEATFSEPAQEQALLSAESQLGMRLPQELRELLAESNGVLGEYDLALIWPIERIVADNRLFREDESFRDLYMPFDGLLFFADAGNGDQFAFTVAGGQVRRPDIFVWDHEEDSRRWLANDLRDYLEGWLSGRIAI